ncbi:hypothetical protein [Paenibacillus turpanensis]|uniref:hypothetical protein n=1 Tax=Paenibacillus turpanensis TaxID=2689078 RepID=UPI00140D7B1D|nr:hypothetical protein [Paenibacillus turpanensis]
MHRQITKAQVKTLIGKNIVAVKKDGTKVSGKLVSVKGNQLNIRVRGKKVKTKAILPLVLFDLLAIGTAPYAGYGYGGYPGYGAGYGGYPGYGAYGAYGYPGIGYGFF